MTDLYVPKLKGISEIQERIQDIHPFLEKLFPVAIVEDGYFLVYDVNPGGNNYHFILKAPVPLPIPQGVRAALWPRLLPQPNGLRGQFGCFR